MGRRIAEEMEGGRCAVAEDVEGGEGSERISIFLMSRVATGIYTSLFVVSIRYL